MPSPRRSRDEDLNTRLQAVEAGKAIVVPLPDDPDERVRMAATLVREGFIGVQVGTTMAGVASIQAFHREVARLQIPDVFVNTTTFEHDLAISATL